MSIHQSGVIVCPLFPTCLKFLFISDFLIDSELTVKPGTPLTMTIALDRKSSDIYGVMVSNMEVTDTRSQEEILILNG